MSCGKAPVNLEQILGSQSGQGSCGGVSLWQWTDPGLLGVSTLELPEQCLQCLISHSCTFPDLYIIYSVTNCESDFEDLCSG